MTTSDTLRWGALAAALLLAAPAARAQDAADAPADAPKADAPAPEAAATEAPKAEAPAAEAPKLTEAPKLERGGSPTQRERVHVLISRKERAEGKQEIALFGSVQVNGKFTEHLGLGLDYAYHLREAFAVTAGGTWFARGVQSDFTETELITKARQQPFTASALLLQWEGHVGLELSPIYGKFAFFDSSVVQFGLYLGSSLGVAQTRVQLRPADPNNDRDRTFGDTGLKPVGIFNAGFRMFFSERIAFKAEVRDTVFSGAVQTINGCTYKDLQAVAASPRGKASVPAGCNQNAFPDNVADGQIASDLVKDPSSDVLNTVSFVAAVSVLF
jgi:outer membrane beta-barrel protein